MFFRQKIRGAYEHLNGWQNRLILGDSLQVMNSLLEYEGLGGQVQMVYMDLPYGVKFGGNFQPFVRKRRRQGRRRQLAEPRAGDGQCLPRHMGIRHPFLADLYARPPVAGTGDAD